MWPLLTCLDLEPQRGLKENILEIQDCGMGNGYLEITHNADEKTEA